MKTIHKIVMLPTEKASDLIICQHDNKLEIHQDSTNKYKYGRSTISQHLYILSDKEIKEGDQNILVSQGEDSPIFTCKSIEGNKLILINKEKELTVPKNWVYKNKIIATTDKSLEINTGKTWSSQSHGTHFFTKPLLQIPSSFLPIFVKAYNEGNPITKVELEYEQKDFQWIGESNVYPYSLKTTESNEVIISLPEVKMYSRDAGQAVRNFFQCVDDTWEETDVEKWIKENL